MKRKDFIKTILGTSILISMDGFSSVAESFIEQKINMDNTGRYATYGAIHLNNTSLKKSTLFWTKVVGMKLRKSVGGIAEFGTENETLVVVHETAKSKFKKGFSGLYHVAIHVPNIQEFASMVNRLNSVNYRYSPVDHTMSKSIYLDDPDGINIEFTLETPERFKRVISEGGLRIEDSDGNIRGASAPLDMAEVMKNLVDNDVTKVISSSAYIGHVHLYANNVSESNAFYKQMGFMQFNYLPEFMYADLGAGGKYKHRIALNSWHGQNRPMAPKETAGMRHFNIVFKNEDKLKEAIASLPNFEKKDDGYWVKDPTGNLILITNQA